MSKQKLTYRVDINEFEQLIEKFKSKGYEVDEFNIDNLPDNLIVTRYTILPRRYETYNLYVKIEFMKRGKPYKITIV